MVAGRRGGVLQAHHLPNLRDRPDGPTCPGKGGVRTSLDNGLDVEPSGEHPGEAGDAGSVIKLWSINHNRLSKTWLRQRPLPKRCVPSSRPKPYPASKSETDNMERYFTQTSHGDVVQRSLAF